MPRAYRSFEVIVFSASVASSNISSQTKASTELDQIIGFAYLVIYTCLLFERNYKKGNKRIFILWVSPFSI